MIRAVLIWSIGILAADPAVAEIRSDPVAYSDGGVELKGHLYFDSTWNSPRPGVLVVHEWWGLNDHARASAERLAEAGYVAFALDMYGAGKTTEHPEEAGKWASEIRMNEAAWLQRGRAGLDVLLKSDRVDKSRIAAIGYCFGGSTVLQMALHKFPLAAVTSFHGALPKVDVDSAKGAKSKILVCHGSEDSFVPAAAVESFQKGLNEAGVDWEMISYGGARHSFTNPDADKHGIDGLRYNAAADRRSWAQMRQFLEEGFGAKP